ncbi:MAG: hypothetical protein E5W30_17025, partial [Mesorhizobium sp.]
MASPVNGSTSRSFASKHIKFDHVDKTQTPFHSPASDIPENGRLDTAVNQRGTSMKDDPSKIERAGLSRRTVLELGALGLAAA